MRVFLAFLAGLAVCVLVGTITLRILRWRDDVRVEAAWESLDATGGDGRFDPASVADLPEPARRFFLHAIEPGARLARSVDLRLEGEFVAAPAPSATPAMSAGAVAELVADERITPERGFVWRVDLENEKFEISGAEWLIDGAGRRSFWRSFLPAREESSDLDRSLAGRAAIERVFVPPSLLPAVGVRWSAVDQGRASASFDVAGRAFTLTITVDADGRLVAASCERWSNDPRANGGWTDAPYTIEADRTAAEQREGGITIPGKFAAAWGSGAARHEFLRATIVRATFR